MATCRIEQVSHPKFKGDIENEGRDVKFYPFLNLFESEAQVKNEGILSVYF
jgi:hypothetical protein